MKRTKIIYWILTILFGGFMIFSAIPDVLSTTDAVKMIRDDLGYPAYIIPFLGVAKILGAIMILIPGFPKIKEWAYAGLMFDLIGATYSLYSIDHNPKSYLPMFPFILFGFLAYFYYHKRLKETL